MVNFDYYRIFYFVCQYKSFTKAAEILNNNQPNITRCMNILERELNCKLFVRTHRGVSLTPEGKRLYEHISVAYEQISLGEKELEKDRGLESGLISIGASETALRLLLLDKLESFHKKYPHVRLRIASHSTPEALTALENGLVDFAVVSSPAHTKKPLQKTLLVSFKEILLGGPKFAQAANTPLHLQDLRDYPFISLGGRTSTRDTYMELFLQRGLPFQPDMEASATDQILPMIMHNLGIGFFPEILAQDALRRGQVIQIPLAEEIPARDVYLVRDSTRPQSIAVRKMIAALKE